MITCDAETAAAIVALAAFLAFGIGIGAWLGNALGNGGQAVAVLNNSATAACVSALISTPMKNGSRAVVLQVGAHLAWRDANDQLNLLQHEAALRAAGGVALLIEPSPNVFELLQKTVAPHSPHIRAARSAVCAQDDREEVTFYSLSKRVDPRTGVLDAAWGQTLKLPPWATQTASLDREMLLRNLPGGERYRDLLSKHVVATTVRCDTIRTTLRRNGLSPTTSRGLMAARLRVLQLDCEGHDAAVVASLGLCHAGNDSEWLGDLGLLMFEHKHSPTDALCDAMRELDRAGFDCECDATNVRCVRRATRALSTAISEVNDAAASTALCPDISSHWPRAPGPWGSCSAGSAHLRSLRGRCLRRKWWVWGEWHVHHAGAGTREH